MPRWSSAARTVGPVDRQETVGREGFQKRLRIHMEELGMKVKPLNDRVLIKRMEAEEEVRGGIVIPDAAKEKPLEGEVVAAGPGRLDDSGKRVAMSVKAGQKVLVGKYAGTEVKIDDVEHVIVREDEILGIVE
jgi:chaperonin GroES